MTHQVILSLPQILLAHQEEDEGVGGKWGALHALLEPPTSQVDRGQKREFCEKQEDYFKGKVVTFTVQSLILCQYPVDLLTFLEVY